MKTTVCKLFFTSVLLLFCLIIRADYLEVTRDASIKEESRGDATIIMHVENGTYLALAPDVEQTDGYYYVQIPSSNQYGWIYGTFVRRYPGDLEASEAVAITDPLVESTYTITSTDREWASYQLELGKPQAIYERVREGYVLAQDARLKIPVWVQYILKPENLTGNIERTDDFRPDNSIPNGARSELSDYSGSGFDRGHMAPAGDMTRSTKVMSESFLLSNMVP